MVTVGLLFVKDNKNGQIETFFPALSLYKSLTSGRNQLILSDYNYP